MVLDLSSLPRNQYSISVFDMLSLVAYPHTFQSPFAFLICLKMRCGLGRRLPQFHFDSVPACRRQYGNQHHPLLSVGFSYTKPVITNCTQTKSSACRSQETRLHKIRLSLSVNSTSSLVVRLYASGTAVIPSLTISHPSDKEISDRVQTIQSIWYLVMKYSILRIAMSTVLRACQYAPRHCLHPLQVQGNPGIRDP
ncbi:hypothetical protein VFPPC_16002 [Pochonia chlamydosporia 170]|uniref:Uncharacterized protein n=1 Tax=Pochonia chlamydosporia 170 TaxID=1380566 RepID=A0A179FL15_METCM|nr:hypothetical protein VFPPC_16002 [Pochonia chlamydosporia 170]OAQ66272.1 hypothetical protein VFPPC_16002 [Pochonia chlamydosporia 170]